MPKYSFNTTGPCILGEHYMICAGKPNLRGIDSQDFDLERSGFDKIKPQE